MNPTTTDLEALAHYLAHPETWPEGFDDELADRLRTAILQGRTRRAPGRCEVIVPDGVLGRHDALICTFPGGRLTFCTWEGRDLNGWRGHRPPP
jgi:hypothetical protein